MVSKTNGGNMRNRMMVLAGVLAVGMCAGCSQQDNQARSDVQDLQKRVGDLERSMSAQQAAYRTEVDQLRTEIASARSAVASHPAATSESAEAKKPAQPKAGAPKKKR